MIMLSQQQVIRLHEKLLAKTGGLEGIRDLSLLDSALSTAFQTFDGAELYPSSMSK